MQVLHSDPTDLTSLWCFAVLVELFPSGRLHSAVFAMSVTVEQMLSFQLGTGTVQFPTMDTFGRAEINVSVL